jgi:molecular chaperone DnaK
MGYFFGIDFGTTNSAVVAINTGNGSDIEMTMRIGESNRIPLPSYVAINKLDGSVRTGSEVKRGNLESDKYQVFPSVKMVIDADKEWKIAGKIWTPVDIATELFKALKKNVETKIGNATVLKEAVVAIPVNFSPKKRNNIREAARRAGIRISMFISEPTAAYCSRIKELHRYKNVAVFDWGGGTLDVVVLEIENNVIHELSTAEMPLAGKYLRKKFVCE